MNIVGLRQLGQALTVGVLLMCAAITPAHAGRRVALVIGNAAYTVKPLENPVRDATAVAAAFKTDLGFDSVALKTNLTRPQMVEALQAFEREAAGAEVAVIFFAGHGTALFETYLVPVDARLAYVADLEDEAISLKNVLRRLKGTTGLRLVILDACRNPPFALAGSERGETRGLTRVEPDDNTLVAYATKDGATADDGKGTHSPFTAALLANMATPGLDVSEVFGGVRDDVMAATGRQQQPFLYGSLGRRKVVLKPGIVGPAVAAVAPVAPPAVPSPPVAAPSQGEPPVHECDRLAARSDSDLVPGVELEEIDGVKATAACETALRSYPETARFQAQLGRAMAQQGLHTVAREWFEKAAANGDPGAMASLGALFWGGNGVTQDYGTARGWLEKGAAKGHPGAMRNLGLLYYNGHGVKQDYAVARDWWEKAATKGLASAMTGLGMLYDQGLGVRQDNAVARDWYEKAAAKGDIYAIYNIGVYYHNGDSVTQDYAVARSWYEKAAAKGSAEGFYGLGLLYDFGKGVPQNYTTARTWYEKAAAKGNAAAMFNLGVLYGKGQGVSKDAAAALNWYEKAAALGDTDAKSAIERLAAAKAGPRQPNKAQTNQAGDAPITECDRLAAYPFDETKLVAGVTKIADPAKAITACEEALAKYPTSGRLEYYLGWSYQSQSKNDLALTWYKRAVNNGSDDAFAAIGILYRSGLSVEKNYQTARTWFEKGADKGSRASLTHLGNMYQLGDGVQKDLERARELYERAAHAGHPYAMTLLGKLYESGIGVDKDVALAQRWYAKAAALNYENGKRALDKLLNPKKEPQTWKDYLPREKG